MVNAFQMKVEVLDLGLVARAQAKGSSECQILNRRKKTHARIATMDGGKEPLDIGCEKGVSLATPPRF